MKKDTLEEKIVDDFVARFFVYDMEKNKPHGDHVGAEKTAAEWLRTTFTSYRKDVLEEVLAALKEIETWPEPQPGAGAELGALAGVGMYMQYDNDRKKHAEQIRHLIKSLKVDIIKR